MDLLHKIDFKTPPNPIFSYSPVVFTVPGRQVELQLKVSAPASGTSLPIILFSHGHGGSNFLSSLKGYGPLVDFYAANGFVVIQPTHQSSKSLGLSPTEYEGDLFWRSRAEDMHFILDNLSHIEAIVPGLQGRVDKEKIIAMGHSLGGHTVGLLAGMEVTDPINGKEINFKDMRIKAAVLMGAPGSGKDLANQAAERFPILRHNNFSEMTIPTLVVVGEKDQSPIFSDRSDWRSDAFRLSNGPKCLLTIFGGEHMLGGISGYDAFETTDESPEKVALIQMLTLAYMRSELYTSDSNWEDAKKAIQDVKDPNCTIECKGYL